MHVSQMTRDGETYELKRYKTDKPGKQYEYVVMKDGKRVGGGVYTRDEGEQMLRELAVDDPSTPSNSGPSLPGMGGMGPSEGSESGFGPMFGSDPDDEEDDDDDGPSIPGLGF